MCFWERSHLDTFSTPWAILVIHFGSYSARRRTSLRFLCSKDKGGICLFNKSATICFKAEIVLNNLLVISVSSGFRVTAWPLKMYLSGHDSYLFKVLCCCVDLQNPDLIWWYVFNYHRVLQHFRMSGFIWSNSVGISFHTSLRVGPGL